MQEFDLFQRSVVAGSEFAGSTTTIIQGVEVPICIIGHSACPLLGWLMKPYPENRRLKEEQNCFNFRLSSCRMVIKSMLKQRWRCRGKCLGEIVPNAVLTIGTCVLLNFCLMFDDDVIPEWIDNGGAEVVEHYGLTACNRRYQNRVREAITEAFWQQSVH